MTYIDKCLIVAGMLLMAMAIVAQGEADRAAIERRTSHALSPRPAVTWHTSM